VLTDLLTRLGLHRLASIAAHLVPDLSGGESAANDQLSERVGHLAVGLQVGLDVLLHGERHVCVPDALAECLPVDLCIAACGGVAVPLMGNSP
jgi:hypothetical protein